MASIADVKIQIAAPDSLRIVLPLIRRLATATHAGEATAVAERCDELLAMLDTHEPNEEEPADPEAAPAPSVADSAPIAAEPAPSPEA